MKNFPKAIILVALLAIVVLVLRGPAWQPAAPIGSETGEHKSTQEGTATEPTPTPEMPNGIPESENNNHPEPPAPPEPSSMSPPTQPNPPVLTIPELTVDKYNRALEENQSMWLFFDSAT
jgi:hypothetical protein